MAKNIYADSCLQIDPARTRFVLLTLLVALFWNFSSSLLGAGWLSATLITFGISGWYVIHVVRHRDMFLARILVFSLIAGWVELLADHWLVKSTSTLVYQPGGVFVWCSPLYMPFAWMVVTTQLSYIGWWLSKRLGMFRACVLTGLIGAINIPLYEQWAKNANWWYYRDTSMLGDTPWFIIGGEFIIALVLPVAMLLVEKNRWSACLLIGLVQGLWILGAYWLAFGILQ